ncbi:MAG: DMT family transporter [Rhizobiales bacterium]|nr:DMT family transporter [Hyphomicrobiales bacterium]MBI3674162.1 DMT family transporter [Hyphomicrobiales bacterium]
MLLATAAFVANDTGMKLAMDDAPPLQVLVMRGIAAIAWCLPLLLALGHGRALAHVFNRWVLLRCLGEVFAIYFFIFALRNMAIGDITAIAQTTPLIVLLAASIIWGERIGRLRLVLVGIGIAGAILVAQPGSAAASPYALLGFGTALGAAVRDIVSRKVDAAIPALVVTFATLLTVMVAAALGMAAIETPVVPSARTLELMAVAGLFLVAGHFFIFYAFRLAPPRVVSPFSYASTIWAVLSGLVVFGVMANALALTGMALILAAGLGVIMLEGRNRQGATPAQDGKTKIISS